MWIAGGRFVIRLNLSKTFSTISINWRSKENLPRHTGKSFILIKEDMLGPQEWEASPTAAPRRRILGLHHTGLPAVLHPARFMHRTPQVANLATTFK